MRAPFEVWASPEPTVARIRGESYRDQLAETGHDARPSDLDLLASLGIDATRYPVLWERCVARIGDAPNFTWARERLDGLRARAIEPIVTLLHHGSGPLGTDLLDADFPERFADFAGRAAAAFPWVGRWTPINEPLTTARFATLYGHWYPNARDDGAFGRAITNEALAMLLGMAAIAAHAPHARFMITEDLQNFVTADDRARGFAAHKRERSFLSIELAMGRIVRGHPMYAYLRERCGIPAATLDRIRSIARAPDLVGWNYYPHSERILGVMDGGAFTNDALHTVAPTAALPLLRAAHERLGLPFGLSEVHVHGDDDARVAWFRAREADVRTLVAEGAPAVMLGAWAAFGLVDWQSLLVEEFGICEDGVFTFAGRGGLPRETRLARELRRLTGIGDVALARAD